MSSPISLTIDANKLPAHLRQYFQPTSGCGNCFVCKMVEVFAEVWRVLRSDGTLWLNIGDSYATNPGNGRGGETVAGGIPHRTGRDKSRCGLKPKDLMLMPARVALALQEWGWWVRSDIIWCKRAPMPESVTDRPTSAHEHVFLLSKSERYFYDADAVRETLSDGTRNDPRMQDMGRTYDGKGRGAYGEVGKANGSMQAWSLNPLGRNMWNYWVLSPEAYPNAHFATFPTEIPRRAILAGTSERGVCSECGSPWRRVVMPSEDYADVKASWIGKAHQDVTKELERGKQQGWGRDKPRVTMETVTTGWEPTCKHNAPIVPATVLDCFSGAGTTVMTALRLGRRAIGIELNPQYVALSEARIVADAPLFNTQLWTAQPLQPR